MVFAFHFWNQRSLRPDRCLPGGLWSHWHRPVGTIISAAWHTDIVRYPFLAALWWSWCPRWLPARCLRQKKSHPSVSMLGWAAQRSAGGILEQIAFDVEAHLLPEEVITEVHRQAKIGCGSLDEDDSAVLLPLAWAIEVLREGLPPPFVCENTLDERTFTPLLMGVHALLALTPSSVWHQPQPDGSASILARMAPWRSAPWARRQFPAVAAHWDALDLVDHMPSGVPAPRRRERL